jgi:hypothetical protein
MEKCGPTGLDPVPMVALMILHTSGGVKEGLLTKNGPTDFVHIFFPK